MSSKMMFGQSAGKRIGGFLAAIDHGRVSLDELEMMGKRPSKKELPELIAKQVALLREALKEVDEPMKIGILAVVASLGNERQDLDDVFHEIFDRENGNRPPIIAVITSILAESGDFEAARVCAERITDGAYWKAQAWMASAAYSGHLKDLQMASVSAREITDSRKKEVLAEIAHVKKHQHPKQKRLISFRASLALYESLGRLLNVLRALSAFSQTNIISEELRGARQRLLAESIILDILSKQIH